MAETVDSKPVFRDAFKRHRCFVPIEASYDWRKLSPKEKQAYAIALADRGLDGAGRAVGDVAVAGQRDGAVVHQHHDDAERAMRQSA
jgi:hypothetical protein